MNDHHRCTSAVSKITDPPPLEGYKSDGNKSDGNSEDNRELVESISNVRQLRSYFEKLVKEEEEDIRKQRDANKGIIV